MKEYLAMVEFRIDGKSKLPQPMYFSATNEVEAVRRVLQENEGVLAITLAEVIARLQ